MSKLITRLSLTGFLAILAIALVMPAGCRGQKPPTSAGIELSSTLVPNLNLDAYVYVKQDNPTKIPRSIVGAPSDVTVESLAIWGVATDDQLTIGGALTLTSAADAANLRAQIPGQAGVWTSVSDRTMYFVQGSGAAAESLKAAISKNDFKYYKEQDALADAARLPNGGNTKLAVIAVVKPSKPVVKLVAKVAPKMADMMGSLVAVAQLQPIIVGLYTPGQIDIADVAQRVERGTIWEAELGIVALVKSGLPGAVVGPIASQVLENAGYTITNVGRLSLYRGALSAGNGKTIPVLLNLDGNSLSIVASNKEAYAQTIITGVKK